MASLAGNSQPAIPGKTKTIISYLFSQFIPAFLTKKLATMQKIYYLYTLEQNPIH
jgi:hypothetical protein